MTTAAKSSPPLCAWCGEKPARLYECLNGKRKVFLKLSLYCSEECAKASRADANKKRAEARRGAKALYEAEMRVAMRSGVPVRHFHRGAFGPGSEAHADALGWAQFYPV